MHGQGARQRARMTYAGIRELFRRTSASDTMSRSGAFLPWGRGLLEEDMRDPAEGQP
jgi:hypothetical protein